MLETLLCAGLQFLEPLPGLAEVGETVSVRAVDASGEGIAQLPVAVVLPGGDSRDLGRTNASGRVSFVPTQPGEHSFVAELPAPGGAPVKLLTPYHVVQPPRRWLYAIACVPLGLLLLWANFRRLRVRPGPSPRAP